MTKINVCVRIYLQAGSQEEGQKLSQEVEEQLRLLAPIELCEKKPYWKIPDYYGVFTVFAPVAELEQLFEKIAPQSENGWSQNVKSTDIHAESIWNKKPGSRFLSDSVRWAHVFYESVADNPRFLVGQRVRVVEDETHPKMKEVRGLIGTVSALPSSDDEPSYYVSFSGDRGNRVWQISEEDLEPADS